MTRFATWLILALIAIAAVGALILTAVPSLAQGGGGQICGSRQTITDGAAQWGVARVAIGIDGAGQVVEFWGNAISGHWAMTIMRPDGMMCMVGSGVAFEPLSEPLPVEGDPT